MFTKIQVEFRLENDFFFKEDFGGVNHVQYETYVIDGSFHQMVWVFGGDRKCESYDRASQELPTGVPALPTWFIEAEKDLKANV